jgi:hypothetical protein
MSEQLTMERPRYWRETRSIKQYGNDDDMVIPFLDWVMLAGLTETTARELRAQGKGPRCVKITDKKLGVKLGEHRRWIKARMEAAVA